MDSSILNFSPGIAFSNKIRSLLGSPVISPFPDDDHSFWLTASVARSKLKTDEKNVGLILQSILGGVASEFAVVEIQDWKFKFTVFSRDVGLLVYKLGIVSNPVFKLAFNLWNERGMHLANSFIADATSTQHPRVHVLSKKDKRSYAEIARSPSPLSGSKAIPLGRPQNQKRSSVFGRLNSGNSYIASTTQLHKRNVHTSGNKCNVHTSGSKCKRP